MNFDNFLEDLVKLDGNDQLKYLSKFSNYKFSKNEIFEIFSLIDFDNYSDFCIIFKDLLSKLNRLDYYVLLAYMHKEIKYIDKYGSVNYLDNYFEHFVKLDGYCYEEIDLYYNNLLELSIKSMKTIDEDKINLLYNFVISKIKKNKDMSFNELAFICMKVLKEKGLIKLSNKISNTSFSSAYGYTSFKLYMLAKPECKIQIDYNKIKKEYKGDYKELLFMFLYAVLHEIEHVRQVSYCLSKSSYVSSLGKKLAVLYKRGFFIESLIGHENMCDYNNITIEYNAKLIGMLNALSMIEKEYGDLFDEHFINKKYSEVNKLIKDNYLNYRNFNSLFSKYEDEYNASKYKRDFDNNLISGQNCYNFVNFDNQFLDEQFMMLLMGEDNVFKRIVDRKDIPFNEQVRLILNSIKKGNKGKS